METIAKPKKCGNSIGIIIPKEIIEKQKITLKDELVIRVEKKKSDAEKKKLLKEGHLELNKINKEILEDWKAVDSEWPD